MRMYAFGFVEDGGSVLHYVGGELGNGVVMKCN